ncbi:LysM peptidoglycan-binding domain-containing protein [Sporofaciens sp. JLR.KK001]|uniref:LysM peptidoglycan-binding domain-containing protein n=1 Tax=Sporofaciens sp. JLR.KK001 TaxID=3112621 RepID=UPI002FEEE790
MRRQDSCMSGMKRDNRMFIKRLLLIVIVSIFALGLSVILPDDPVDAHIKNTATERGSGVLDRCKYYTSIEVSTGDSLWSIAEEYMDARNQSVYDYIDEIKEINGLKSDQIRAGEYLMVSYYGYE